MRQFVTHKKKSKIWVAKGRVQKTGSLILKKEKWQPSPHVAGNPYILEQTWEWTFVRVHNLVNKKKRLDF